MGFFKQTIFFRFGCVVKFPLDADFKKVVEDLQRPFRIRCLFGLFEEVGVPCCFVFYSEQCPRKQVFVVDGPVCSERVGHYAVVGA